MTEAAPRKRQEPSEKALPFFAICPHCKFKLDAKGMSKNTSRPVFWCCSCEKWWVGDLIEIDPMERSQYYLNEEISD